MNSIKTKTVNERIVKKSRFIAIAYPVFDESDIQTVFTECKKEYPNANHYTYAYILGDNENIQKASDDGEPTRTAGFPILEVLLNNKMTNVIIVVVRYFGGIKLGTGGLIRAYASSASSVLNLVTKTKKITTYTCSVTCCYDCLGNMDKYLRENTNLINVAYDKEITFNFEVTDENFEDTKTSIFSRNHFEEKLIIISKKSAYR